MRMFAAVMILAGSLATTATAQQTIVDRFEVRSHTFEGFTLPYRLFVPANYDPMQAYPLVLALHGAGERGTDNERHIQPHRLATSWADPVNQADYPAFVVAPQVPPNGRWTADRPVDQSAFNAEELTTLAILDALEAEFTIDPDRVYVVGLSMGGHGVWDFISRLPDRFAAAVPMSGNADPTQADRVLHIPIWAFHGESDTVVPASGSRGIIYAMENLGRDVVYTECRRSLPFETNFNCPGAIANTTLEQAIDDHADLIFTSVRNGGHGPWNVWFDHPLLNDWLFSKYRVDPEGIAFTAPLKSTIWTGIHEITWTATGPATDIVEVWLSLDDGATWQSVDEGLLSEVGYALDTSAYPDTPFARVRLFVRNEAGFVYSRQTSEPFIFDNTGDAPPTLFVNDEPLRFNPNVTEETVTLDVRAADPEGNALTTTIFYSIDGGLTFARVETVERPSSQDPQPLTVNVAALPNTLDAQLRIEVTDGSTAVAATTASFAKENLRDATTFVEHVQGEGLGMVTLHFIEPANLTGHRYRITFDDTDPAGKTYSVFDLDQGTMVLTAVPLSDGVRESPLFDGMRLVVQDEETGMADLENTGWITGDSNLGVTISGGTVRIAILSVTLLDTEDEYELTVTDAIADTSVAMYGRPALPLYFTVTARSDGERRKVVYDDAAGDGRPGDGDVLHILEETPDGTLAPAWEFRFSAADATVFPEPGDTFLLVPLRKLSAQDVFEFVAAVDVAVEEEPAWDDVVFLSGYPNPFTDRVTIAYRLAEPARITLDVFDILGRRVATLVDDVAGGGDHQAAWSGTTASGARVAGGVYLIRLTTRSGGSGAVRRYYRSVLRVR